MTNTSIEIIGIHKVPSRKSIHLIELIVRNPDGPLDFGEITQDIPGEDESSWQVAYDEKVLIQDGTGIVFDPWFPEGDVSKHWFGDVRVAFFFHYLDFGRPLRTPYGDVPLMAVTTLPARLKFMKYEPP